MKSLILTLSFLMSVNLAYADILTGKDWLGMTAEEKTDFVSDSFDGFKSEDVTLKLTPKDYSITIDEWLRDPRLQKEQLEIIFSSIVYEREPQARGFLKASRIVHPNKVGLSNDEGRIRPKWGWAGGIGSDDPDRVPGNY